MIPSTQVLPAMQKEAADQTGGFLRATVALLREEPGG
jgi:hypothetical protein